jgi:hypothetical protein
MFKRLIAVFFIMIGLQQAAHCRDNLLELLIDKNEAAGQSTSRALSVTELLQRYTKALDATQSFTDTYEEVCDYSYRMPDGARVAKGKRFARGQNRADGARLYRQNYYWGDFNPKLMNLPESNSRYNLRIEADGKLYAYSTAVNDSRVKGTAYLQPSLYEKGVMNRSRCSGLHGFLGSDERLDAVLRRAKRVSVRPTTELVNGVACHVIDANTEYGRYKVYLDPIHGFHAVKIIREATGGQKEQEDVMPKGDRSTAYMVVTRFEQVDGVWVPVEAEQETDYTSGEFFRRSRNHYKRANIVLNPNHDKLGSFDNPLEHPDNDPELKNGTRVSITGPGSVRVRGSWQDGKVVDESGQVINISQLWTDVTDSLLNKSLPALTELSKDLSEIRSSDKSILICFFDIEQRPSRNCILQLSKRAQELKEKDIVVVAIQASKVERAKLDEWVKESSISFPAGIIESDSEKILSTWGVKSLPWLILTDKKHIVVAEGFSLDELDEKIKTLKSQ